MVFFTSGWAREPIKAGYQQWFDALKDGDEVCLQRFNTPTKVLGFPFETWSFEIGVFRNWNGNPRFMPKDGSDPNPFLATDGRALYSPEGKEWGNVFPARAVPLTNDLGINAVRQYRSIGHMPVYEPLYLGMARSAVLVQFGPDFHFKLRQTTKDRRHYHTEVDGGYLVHIFDNAPLTDLEGFLYSQYIDN
jgi:hypothetical protein